MLSNESFGIYTIFPLLTIQNEMGKTCKQSSYQLAKPLRQLSLIYSEYSDISECRLSIDHTSQSWTRSHPVCFKFIMSIQA